MARGNPRPHGRAGRLRGNRRTLAFAAAGLATGAAIKVLDVSTSNAANVFSQLTVWVLVCAAIAVLSESPPARIAQRVPLLRGDALYILSRGGGAGRPLFARVRDGVTGILAAQPAFRAPRLDRKGPWRPLAARRGLAWSPPRSPRRSSSSTGLGLGTSLPAPRRPPSSTATPAELDDDRPAAGRADVRPAEAIRRGLSCTRFER